MTLNHSQTAATPDAEESHRTKGLLRLTMACNERCLFCNVPVEDYERPTPPPEEIALDLDAFVESGEKTLVISGGEPTLLRRRLLALITQARSRGIPLVELQTNAILIDADYANALAESGLTSAFISLLSHVPEHHDALAGLQGAFSRCITGIQSLVDVGIRVTLNPVTARQTQALVADYVDFVASELPAVRSISLSAVQPHGRAAQNTEILPDYGVLSEHVRIARKRAAAHGIELINPYCGLPLCVGWEDGMETSVEAIEASTGGWEDKPGIENQGNKRQGTPCRTCALRTRCGGAWHAVWDTSLGRGIEAPLHSILPWMDGADDAQGQSIIHGPGGLTDAHFRALHSADTPTVWAWTDTLATRDAALLIRAGCTDLAVDLALHEQAAIRPTLKILRRLINTARLQSPQRQMRIHLAWRAPEGANIAAGIQLAHALGAWTLLVPAIPEDHAHPPGMDILLLP